MIRNSWPSEVRPARHAPRFDTPGPVEIAKTLIWLMRDRGTLSPDDLCGVSRPEVEFHTRNRKKKKSPYETFDEALEDAIASGWVERFESNGQTFYIPNYKRSLLEGAPYAD